MANTNATAITLLEQTPPKQPHSKLFGGKAHKMVQTVEAPILALNDTVTVFRIPVDCVIHSLKFASDDLGTTGDLNVGFSRTLTDGGAAVDADALATAIDVNAAAVALTEIRYEVKGIETAEQEAWQLAGLSARPTYGQFDIVLTASEATTAAGTITMYLEYTV